MFSFLKKLSQCSEETCTITYRSKDLNYCTSISFYLIDFILATDGHLPIRVSKEKFSCYNILPVTFALTMLYLLTIFIC